MQSASCRNRSALVFVALALSLGACGRGDVSVATPKAPSAEELGELDRGVGLMGQFDFAAARDVFAGLVSRHPDWYEARFDLAVATFNRQQEGDERAAGDQTRALLKERPDDLRALYVLGLMALRTQSPKDAEPLLRRVADGDPRDAYARYFLAQSVLSQGRAEEALALFDGALARDPRLRSARYGASQALTRLGRPAEAAARLEEFQSLRNNPLARLAEFKYTRMGRLAEAVTIAVAKPERLPLLARIVLVYVPGVAPAVNKPELLLMVPAVAFRLAQTSGGGIVTVAPVTSWPAAVYWMLFPTAALPGLGETVMVNN